MKIIIVGNGKVGYAIASQLAGEHHDITMVDSSPTALHRAENALDVMCIQGNGSSISVLKEAGAQSADLVIAVTNLDETNLLCCFIAKKLGAGHTIARVRSTEYRRDADMLKKEIGLDMVINPFCQVLVNFLLYKVLGNRLFFFGLYYHIFLCHKCSSVICHHNYLKSYHIFRL